MKFAKDKFENIIDEIDVDYEVGIRISQHLARTERGTDEVLLTPMAKEFTPEFLLSEFNKVFDSESSKLNETLYKLEMSNKAKSGPRSLAIPWKDRLEQFLTNYESEESHNSADLTLIGQGRLRPLDLATALKLLKNSTNSGLPYYTKKGNVKERVLNKFDALIERRDPCILFTRTQEQLKTRDVWGYPIADTLNEMRYYAPLLAHQKKLSCRAALISPDEVSKKISALILKAKSSNNYVLLSIDFALFDKSVKSKLQKVSFDYIKSNYQRKHESSIQYIADRFRSIGIVTPSGVLKGDHGVPSGSTFTNEVDSIAQMAIALHQSYVEEDNFQVQGDDGVYLVPKDYVDDLIKQFESFGLSVSKDKSYISNNYAIYLQNLFHVDYLKDGIIGGIYPVYRALNRILYQERWSDFEDYELSGKDYYSIRTICILENVKYHPLYRSLVQFVLKYDKYSLAYSNEGLSKYVQMIDKTKGAGEILNHQYGDNTKGIKSFETTKLIRELG